MADQSNIFQDQNSSFLEVLRSPVGLVSALSLLVGLVLRFVADSPLWLDEAQSVALADEGPTGLPDALRGDGHPPLYYVLLSGWMAIMGKTAFAVRALSGFFGVLSLLVVYRVMHRHTDTYAAMATVGVLAASPFAIRYATEARMYALLILLLLLGHLAFVSAWRSPNAPRLAVFAVFVGLLLHTHYWSLFLVAVLTGVLIVSSLTRSNRSSPRLLIAVFAGSLTFIPGLPIFLDQLEHTGTPWAPGPRPTVVAALALEAYGGGRGSEALLVAVVLSVLFMCGGGVRGLASLLGLTDLLWLRIAVGLGAATMLLGAVISLLTQTAFQGRYAVFFFVPVVLGVGVGITRLPRASACLALFILVGLSWISVGRELSRDRTQIGKVGEVVASQGTDGDLVVFCPDQLAPAGNRILADRFMTLAYPALDAGRTVNWIDYADRVSAGNPVDASDRIVAQLNDSKRLWMVWIDGYRNFDDQCGRLHAELTERLGWSEHLVAADGNGYYNAANLNLFKSSPP